MSLYDPERDRVRIAGRWLRWSLGWVAVPALLGVFVSANLDVRALPLVGPERMSAVLFLDGQAYFGHLDDSGESGTLTLRDVYYFKNSQGGVTGVPVGLVRRGTEAHEPADGMRINRDRILAVERVGLVNRGYLYWCLEAVPLHPELRRTILRVLTRPAPATAACAASTSRAGSRRRGRRRRGSHVAWADLHWPPHIADDAAEPVVDRLRCPIAAGTVNRLSVAWVHHIARRPGGKRAGLQQLTYIEGSRKRDKGHANRRVHEVSDETARH